MTFSNGTYGQDRWFSHVVRFWKLSWNIVGIPKIFFNARTPPLPLSNLTYSSKPLWWKNRHVFLTKNSSRRCVCARKLKLTVLYRGKTRLHNRIFSIFFSQLVGRIEFFIALEPKEVHVFFFLKYVSWWVLTNRIRFFAFWVVSPVKNWKKFWKMGIFWIFFHQHWL